MEMKCREAAAAVNGRLWGGNPEAVIGRVSIDSRDIGAGDFFVPLAGERTDGHRFIGMAAQKGAVGCFAGVAARVTPPAGMAVIEVEDTLQALQQMSHIYRRQFNLPVVGITGSVGKTTTKDMTAAVLSAKFNTLKTEGNLNNQIGVPLMLCRLHSGVEAAVLEMGMSGYNEIDLLARLAQPQIGVITNIGESHLEMLGSREGIARAKCELLPQIPPTGAVVVNGDEPLLKPYLREVKGRVITFGFSEDAVMRCTRIAQDETGKTARLAQEGYDVLDVAPPMPGRHNIYNLMAAVAVGRLLGLTDEEIRDGLSRVRQSGMRLEMVALPAGYTVINDAYNASPTSTAAALDVLLEKAGAARKIAVLGDMLELGAIEEQGHRQIGGLAARHRLDALVVLGKRAAFIARGALEAGYPEEKITVCDTHEEAAAKIKEEARPGDWVLLKGSRGMRMEEVLAALSEG